MVSLRSPSSGSSTSSLSSTFSDISFSTSTSSSSPPKPKTNAFFASPFSTRAPTPDFQLPLPSMSHSTSHSTHYLTTDSFATPTRPLSPPSQALSSAKTSMSLLFPARMFPSRHSSIRRSPDRHIVDIDDKDLSSFGDSDPSFSALDDSRLPTPPLKPPKDWAEVVPPASSETLDLSTPRPPYLAPFRLLLTKQKRAAMDDQDGISNDESSDILEPGSTITIPWSSVAPSVLPSPASFAFTVPLPNADLTPSYGPKVGEFPSSTANHAPNPQFTLGRSASTNSLSSLSSNIDTEALHPSLSISTSSSSELRLLRLLGHGAFSSVWLGEDLGHVPLTQLSKRSVRDLRRRASGRRKGRNGDRPSENYTTSFPGKYHDDVVGTKRPLRNMPSLSGTNSSEPPPSSDNIHVNSLLRHPSLPSHSRLPSISKEDLGVLPSLPASPFSSNSVLPPLSPLNLNFLTVHNEGQASKLSRDSSLKKFRERVKGTRPAFCLGRVYLDERDGGMGEPSADEFGFLTTGEENLEGRLSRRSSLGKGREINERLVAIKITPRRVPGSAKEEEERTRVRFVREVEVLKHISHPNITPLLAHLSGPHHHILILPFLPGGDLLTLVNSDVAWGKLTETMMRRMWCELCKAVGWMHGVGLVHRDIKLENVLLATTAFSNLTPESSPPSPTSSSIPPPSSSLIKLADFGLSRFVEINETTGEAELLATRCGSEPYAAPELVTGGREGYDARQTDAWACGVVLYALVGRKLPFGEGISMVDDGNGRKISSEKGRQSATAGLAERRHWLMKIARGEWVWPGEEVDALDRAVFNDHDELVGHTLHKSKGSRRIVEKLLVRDPRKRARIVDLREDVWMCGPDEMWKDHERHQPREERPPGVFQDQHVSPPVIVHDFTFDPSEHEHGPICIFGDSPNGGLRRGPSVDEEAFDDEDDEGGVLLDHDGIDSITRQEVV